MSTKGIALFSPVEVIFQLQKATSTELYYSFHGLDFWVPIQSIEGAPPQRLFARLWGFEEAAAGSTTD
jgi:hypothetical protein